MTPSTNQQGSDDEFRNIWHKVFETDMSPYPLLKGVTNIEKAKTAWNEANRCDVSESVKSDVKMVMQSLQ